MKNVSKYIKLVGQMIGFAAAKDEVNEDKVTDQLDHLWHKEMTKEETEKANSLVLWGTKERYHLFLNAWKQFIADKKHRKYKVAYDACAGEYKRVDGKWICTVPINSYFWKTDLRIEHHVLYALLRNKPLKKMFKKDKTQTGRYGGLIPYSPLHLAHAEISWAAKDGNPKYLEPLLKPFGGTITLDEVKLAASKLQKIYLKTNNFSDLELE